MSVMTQGQIAVVDDDDRFVRWEQRRTIHEQQLVHRSVHILVFDSQARLIIQQRHRDKQTQPLHWDSSCCGHVERSDYLGGPDERLDEVYEAVAGRELLEELNIEAELEVLEHFAPIEGVHYEQLQLFRGFSDDPWEIQTDEVEAARAVTRAQLDAMLTDPQVLITPSLRFFLGWIDANDAWPKPRR